MQRFVWMLVLVGLVVASACGGRVGGEAPEEAGAPDSTPMLDASGAYDAGVTRDASEKEPTADAGGCSSSDATCAEIVMCVEQFVQWTPLGVRLLSEGQGIDYLRMLGVIPPPEVPYGGEFVADGHVYVFGLINGEYLFVEEDAAPAAYQLVLQYDRCECQHEPCAPLDASVD